MEFKEFRNPEEKDYDIKSYDEIISNDEIAISNEEKIFLDLWLELGCPEVYELEPFGISEEEIIKPTKQTIQKLKNYACSLNKGKNK